MWCCGVKIQHHHFVRAADNTITPDIYWQKQEKRLKTNKHNLHVNTDMVNAVTFVSVTSLLFVIACQSSMEKRWRNRSKAHKNTLWKKNVRLLSMVCLQQKKVQRQMHKIMCSWILVSYLFLVDPKKRAIATIQHKFLDLKVDVKTINQNKTNKQKPARDDLANYALEHK